MLPICRRIPRASSGSQAFVATDATAGLPRPQPVRSCVISWRMQTHPQTPTRQPPKLQEFARCFRTTFLISSPPLAFGHRLRGKDGAFRAPGQDARAVTLAFAARQAAEEAL